MGSLDDFAAELNPPAASRRNGQPTEAWRPGYTLDGTEGELVTDAIAADDHLDWDSIFRHWNLDPEAWTVVDGSLRVNAWEGPSQDGPRIYRQYKATIRRQHPQSAPAAIDPVLERIAKARPKQRQATGVSEATFVAAFADWQIGGHLGPESWEQQFLGSLDRVAARARAAAKQGADSAVIGFLGDMVEGLFNYPNQLFEITLDSRSQKRLARAAEAKVITTLAPLFPAGVTVAAVPGNHGRNSPRAPVTNAHDNADLEVVEVVAETLTASGFAERYGVEFAINPEALIVMTEASGTRLVWCHGDQVKGSADKIAAWWKSTVFTNWGSADGHILLTGHRHHLRIEELSGGDEPRWLFQCPTLGGPSVWFAELGNGTSNPGTLSFVTAHGGWWDLHVD